MALFFEFEADFVNSLRCIPMQIRYKLDTCGIKLKLSDWLQMTQDEREALLELPCTTQTEVETYKEYLQQLILERTGTPVTQLPVEPYPTWMDSSNIPIILQEKAQELGVNLTLEQWVALTPLQRFALIKLSRPSHENKNFPHAITEFHLL
ncbi:nitrate reductase associated protein [Nostoc sp. LEGE 06077]|uniref:nitrate reductase associated protein n=1 Tax=Nostoc sp. LEGE 06077 TaxID=915325 RepID=UPI00187EA248|nr:nitrate reductase associated protein [Nostoc sp. LEGE 06077]MBE9210555.1 nitrate reductase associated protein [Nostoc sp. LEGE 06077]